MYLVISLGDYKKSMGISQSDMIGEMSHSPTVEILHVFSVIITFSIFI